jgi:hypothetical protein
MVLVGWYIYAYITHESMKIDFFGIHLPSLSIAMWVVVPMFILFVASFLHISFYSLLGNMKLRKYNKDFEKILDAIVDAYLGKENRNHTFKTSRYKLIGSLIDNATIFPHNNMVDDIQNDKVKEVVTLIDKIKDGKVVDLKKYSLSKSNPLVIQNVKNSYKNETITAEDILNDSTNYDESICKYVYIDIAKKSPLRLIQTHSNFLTKEALFEIMSRINASENTLEMDNEAIIALCEKLELDQDDYLKISKLLSKSMSPDQRIKLFEILSEKNESLLEVYLYTLYDLGMLELAEEILRNSEENEYLIFKAYSILKRDNQNFSIDLFIS